MPAIHCLNIIDVGILIGVDPDIIPERICLSFMNVGLENGNETPDVYPPDFLREAATGDQLFTPDGTPLLVAGP